MTDKLVVGGQLGNYLIDSVIGRGGMSVVYGAKHARLGMPVAVKVLAPELSSDDTFRERFLREAQIAAGIDHQNVIPINDMGLHEDSLYIVMRYVAGGDLKTLLNGSGPLDTEQALRVLTPVAMALDAAHAHGLVHRDVKPANILLQRSTAGVIEHVYLTDFGIAKSAAFSGGLTGAGASIGTVGYMAPEQLEGREVTAQTDVYALAVTFYECLTGRIPFQRELAEGIHPPLGELEPVSRARPDLPVALDAAIAKGLSRDLQARYPTCESFLEACRTAIHSQPAAAFAPSPGASVGDTAVSAAEPTEALSKPQLAASSLAAESGAPSVATPIAASVGDDKGGPARGKGRLIGALVAALIAAAVVVIILASSGSSTPKGAPSDAALAEVPTNHVSGSGSAMVHLNGDSAAITVTTSGLDNGAELVHLMHIHAGGKGQCPPASAARLHNNHLSISTNDGINYYGPPVQALTTHGDTGVASILAFPRFLSGGNLHYSRTIVVPPKVAAAIRNENAVIVVHGTDYDGSGIYSGVLDASELSKSVPATATAPALCGRLVAAQNAAVPNGGRSERAKRYTASLVVNPAPGAQAGAFVCHVGGTTGPAQDSERRRTSV